MHPFIHARNHICDRGWCRARPVTAEATAVFTTEITKTTENVKVLTFPFTCFCRSLCAP